MGLHLEVNHPLYAFCGLRGVNSGSDYPPVDSFFDSTDRCPDDMVGWSQLWRLLLVTLGLVLAWSDRYFWIADPFLWQLHHDYITSSLRFSNGFNIGSLHSCPKSDAVSVVDQFSGLSRLRNPEKAATRFNVFGTHTGTRHVMPHAFSDPLGRYQQRTVAKRHRLADRRRRFLKDPRAGETRFSNPWSPIPRLRCSFSVPLITLPGTLISELRGPYMGSEEQTEFLRERLPIASNNRSQAKRRSC